MASCYFHSLSILILLLSAEDGYRRVLSEDYAFLWDTFGFNIEMKKRPCQYAIVPFLLDVRGLRWAFRKNLPYTKLMNKM